MTRRLDDPELWLEHARADLSLAGAGDTGTLDNPERALRCFHAQQAAEKAIKALCLHRGIEFPYVHDLGRLLQVLADRGEAVPTEIWAVEELSQYAVETRYPFVGEPITDKELERARRVANGVIRWIEGAIASP